MATLSLAAAPLTSATLVGGNRVENCRKVTSFVSAPTRSVTAPKLGLIRCRSGNAGRGRRHATKVAAATATFVVAMATTDGAIRDVTDALQHGDREMIEQEYLDMIQLDDECVFCDVLTRSQSCRVHHYGSQQNPVPAEKRSSKCGAESKKPFRLGSASWDLLD